MAYIVRPKVVIGRSLNGVPAHIEKKQINERCGGVKTLSAVFQSPHSGVASPLDFCHFG
jgi:hypothetical protein